MLSKIEFTASLNNANASAACPRDITVAIKYFDEEPEPKEKIVLVIYSSTGPPCTTANKNISWKHYMFLFVLSLLRAAANKTRNISIANAQK